MHHEAIRLEGGATVLGPAEAGSFGCASGVSCGMASITIVSGPNEGDYYPLGSRTVVIGRDEACPVQIVDTRASRKHLQVRFDEATKQHIALDMKSTNGTLFNGRAVTGDVPLKDGDEMLIGSSKLVYSTADFANKESALSHYKQRGERGRNTIEQR